MHAADAVASFLEQPTFAVVGASDNRAKYGNKVLRCYQQNGRAAIPVHPREEEIEGAQCYASLADLPEGAHGASIITPPHVTESVVEDAAAAGIQHLWMQPGAESPEAVARAESLSGNGKIDGRSDDAACQSIGNQNREPRQEPGNRCKNAPSSPLALS